jgi:alkylation response protein AidB-like acyl-CoA dehydrogenase
MDIGFTEEQGLLRASARRFLENECPTAFVRHLMAEPAAMTGAFWRKLADQGWFGILYPEEAGGSGLGLVDMTVLMEEMGRAVMPGPFFSTVLLGGSAILEAGSQAQRQEWLPRIAAGSAKASLACALGCGRHRGDRPRNRRRVCPVRHQALRAGRAFE